MPVLAASLTLVACVPSGPAPAPAPTPMARPAPVPPSAPPPVVQAPVYDNWMDAPATPGAWRYQPVARGTLAVFASSTAGEFALSCNLDTRSIALTRFGGTRAARTITIHSETATRTLPVTQSGNNPVTAATTVAPNDPLLDAVALSKGRFAVEAEGLAPLLLPSHAEVSRVIEDCRG